MNYGFSPTALPVESSGTSDEGGGEKQSNTVKCGMLAKRLFQKAAHRHHLHHQEKQRGLLLPDDVNIRINVHYGIPSTASILAFDPIQRLLAIGTLDGRIKVIGGENIEALLVSPKLGPYKYLEFLQNQGFLVSITNENDIQVWNLEKRAIDCSLQWESNVTSFSVINGSSFMYVGDEYGMMSVLKYDPDRVELLQLQYQLSSDSLAEATGFSISDRQPIVGILPQSCSSWNRLLIAYESGVIILWDVIDAKVVVVRGNKVLQFKNRVDPPNDADTKIVDDAPYHDSDKEISALCWASSDESILAVGYVDGDILFWNTSQDSSVKHQEDALSPNVVKLQLSSSEKRLPVIVLNWLDNSKTSSHPEGQLLVYGGDEIGCEEVITVLSLEWSSRMEAVRCVDRVDLTLTGSFADMILIPSVGTTGSDRNASLFVLSNPGQIHIYERDHFSSSNLHSGKKQPVSTVKFPASIPTVDPLITVAELFYVYQSIEAIGSEIAALSSTLTLPGSKKWPVSGGVSNHTIFGKDNKACRLYVAGYHDGSIRIWDVTYPVVRLLSVLKDQVNSEKLINSNSSLTALDLCSSTLRLAVGSDCGLVQLYNLRRSDETSMRFVTETSTEVRSSPQIQGPRCEAVFNLQKSGVRALKFSRNGSKLIVGYECSRIVVLDMHSLSIAFMSSSLSSSPVISVIWKGVVSEIARNTNESASKIPDNGTGELIFVLTKDATIYAMDGKSGSMIGSRPVQLKKKSTPISLHVIESQAEIDRSVEEQQVPKDSMLRNDLSKSGAQGSEKHETQEHLLNDKPSPQSLKELFVLLCCKDALNVYPAKSVIHGESKSIYKVKLSKPCCWTAVLKKDAQACGVVVFYQTGEIEIWSLPCLELVKGISLMSDLRWNFRANMEKMISSTGKGHLVLVNGCEVAFISLLEGENDSRIPESLPNLHDEVLAAAANAAISFSSDPKKKERSNTGILRGIVKGLRVRKSNNSPKSDFIDLEGVFRKNPFSEPSTTNDEQEAYELDIDDIEIDDPEPLASTSSHEVDNHDKDKKNRQKLLDDDDDIKPRLRTREEIIAKYRKAEDASSAAGEARNKLLERQEKLERISRRTEDLRNGAEDFASLANELVRAMENRKWYHF